MVYVFGNSFRANTKALERSHMRAARIARTHAAGCSLAGNQPEEDSGSSPSPRTLSPALSPPAVRPGPFPLTQDQARRTNYQGGTDTSPGLTSSSESCHHP